MYKIEGSCRIASNLEEYTIRLASKLPIDKFEANLNRWTEEYEIEEGNFSAVFLNMACIIGLVNDLFSFEEVEKIEYMRKNFSFDYFE